MAKLRRFACPSAIAARIKDVPLYEIRRRFKESMKQRSTT